MIYHVGLFQMQARPVSLTMSSARLGDKTRKNTEWCNVAKLGIGGLFNDRTFSTVLFRILYSYAIIFYI